MIISSCTPFHFLCSIFSLCVYIFESTSSHAKLQYFRRGRSKVAAAFYELILNETFRSCEKFPILTRKLLWEGLP